MASFGSAAGGAFEADRHRDELAARHRQMNIQSAQNRFTRNRIRRQDKEEKRRWETEYADKRDDEAFRREEIQTKFKNENRQWEDEQKTKKEQWEAEQKAQKEQWEAEHKQRQDAQNAVQSRWDAEQKQRQENWQKEYAVAEKESQARVQQIEFDRLVAEEGRKRKQELWDRDNRAYAERRKQQQMQSEEVRAAMASAINNAIAYGDDKGGSFMLTPADVSTMRGALGGLLEGGDNIHGLGIQYAQVGADGRHQLLSHPNVVLYSKDAKSGMLIPQVLPKEKVAGIFEQYPQLWDSVKARNEEAYGKWGQNFGLIKPQELKRNLAVEDYFKQSLKSINEQISEYVKLGTSVPEDLIQRRDELTSEYRQHVGLSDKSERNSGDAPYSVDDDLDL